VKYRARNNVESLECKRDAEKWNGGKVGYNVITKSKDGGTFSLD